MCFSFQLSSKNTPVFFLGGLHFVSEKNKDKISKCTQRNKHKQNSGTIEEDVADNQANKRVSGNFYFLLLSIVMTILVKRMHFLSALKV